MDGEAVFFIVFLMCCCAIGGCIGGGREATNRYQTNAVKAGVAHYVVDPQTGCVTFEYISPKSAQ